MSNPTISVILPVYNGANYLRFAIESVLNQTFRDYELIIIDDGSVDSTPLIAREYGQRLKYVRQENTGVAGAFNHGLRLAAGRYISWLSHDDVMLPGKLEKQVSALSSIGSPAVCYTDFEMIDSRGKVIVQVRMPEHNRLEVLRHIVTGGPICSATFSIMYDRKCIEEVGFYSEHRRNTQDAEMLIRFAKRFPLIRVSEVLMQGRDHADRGSRLTGWEREVIGFILEHLESTPLDELFPEGIEAGEAHQWIGDALAERSYPIFRVAYPAYRKALKANPAKIAILSKMARLGIRDASEILLRTTRFVPSLDRAIWRLRWRIPPALRRVLLPPPPSITRDSVRKSINKEA